MSENTERSNQVDDLFETIKALAPNYPHFEIITIFGGFMDISVYLTHNHNGNLTFSSKGASFYGNQEKFIEKVFPRFGKEVVVILNLKYGEKHKQLEPAPIYVFDVRNIKNKITITARLAEQVPSFLKVCVDKKIGIDLSSSMIAMDLLGNRKNIDIDEIYAIKYAGMETEDFPKFDRVYDAIKQVVGDFKVCVFSFDDNSCYGRYVVCKDEQEDLHFDNGPGENTKFNTKLNDNIDKLVKGEINIINCTAVVRAYDEQVYRELDYYFMFSIEMRKNRIKIKMKKSETVKDLMFPKYESDKQRYKDAVFCDVNGRIYNNILGDEIVKIQKEEEEYMNSENNDDDDYDEDGNYIGAGKDQLCSICGIVNDILKPGQSACLNFLSLAKGNEEVLEMMVEKITEGEVLYTSFNEKDNSDQHDAIYKFLADQKCDSFVCTLEIVDESSTKEDTFVDHYAFYIYTDEEYTSVEPASAERSLLIHVGGHEKKPDKVIKKFGNKTFCDTDGMRIEADMFVEHSRKLREGKEISRDDAFYDINVDSNEFYNILNRMIGKNNEAILFMDPINESYWHDNCISNVKKDSEGHLFFGEDADENLLFRARLIHSAECGANFKIKVFTEQTVDGLKVAEFYKIKVSVNENKKVIVGIMNADDVQKSEFRPGETNPIENKVFCDLTNNKICQWDLPGYKRQNYSKNLRLSLRNKSKKK